MYISAILIILYGAACKNNKFVNYYVYEMLTCFLCYIFQQPR
ncbi:hypothetical protein CLCAR_4095 [Clostridium carboxidivorans P7]|nr:hypothetical protein CLCAR_4095 [Clostridium carboxidivorans P7]